MDNDELQQSFIFENLIKMTIQTKKPVWQCMNATKNGINSCPHCKAIDEVIIESAF